MRGALVVGLARSGTSLLKALLDGHPEVWAPPGESWAVEWCGAADPASACLAADRDLKLVQPDTPEYERFARALHASLDGPVDPARAVRAWMAAAAEVDPPRPAARVWVEKTPKHLRWVPVLLGGLGPDARVICVVRDPRASFASFRKRWSNTTPVDAPRMARRWALADALADDLAARHPEVLVVRYEDLVCHPTVVMQRVARHLSVAWDEILAVPTRGGRPWAGNSSFGEGHRGVSRASLRRWKDALEPSLVAELERLLGPRMARRGYEPECAPSHAPWWRDPMAGLQRAALSMGTQRRLSAERRRWREDAAAGADASA